MVDFLALTTSAVTPGVRQVPPRAIQFSNSGSSRSMALAKRASGVCRASNSSHSSRSSTAWSAGSNPNSRSAAARSRATWVVAPTV